MATKPISIVSWAENTNQETRQGGINKVEPINELKLNGSLDGEYALNHLNWMFNVLGLWSQFTNELVTISNGAGIGLSKNDHLSFIIATDKTDVSKHIVAIAFKSGSSAATTHILQSATLTLGTPNINGNIAINGATSSNIISFSINVKQ